MKLRNEDDMVIHQPNHIEPNVITKHYIRRKIINLKTKHIMDKLVGIDKSTNIIQA